LDGFGGQPDLPANVLLALRNPALNEGKLDAVGFIKAQSVEVRLWEVLPSCAGSSEVVHGLVEVSPHSASSAAVWL
jgi:hypothetical protein